jgi:hypothetical protein
MDWEKRDIPANRVAASRARDLDRRDFKLIAMHLPPE